MERLELMDGTIIDAERLGTLKNMPVFEVDRGVFTENFERNFKNVRGIYFSHRTSSNFRTLIYEGNVVGHISNGGNVTWCNAQNILPWEVVYRPLEMPKKDVPATASTPIVEKPVFKMETKVPQPYKSNGGIADIHYIDNIMNKLLADSEAICRRLKGDGK
jgi:hypothetical protein